MTYQENSEFCLKIYWKGYLKSFEGKNGYSPGVHTISCNKGGCRFSLQANFEVVNGVVLSVTLNSTEGHCDREYFEKKSRLKLKEKRRDRNN
ncbi:MAG TPA: hypothetical protein VI819_02670 [Patescibacteria group bacterium]|nr:hypothetical protein [Patescibacteria group bacterium]